MVRSTRSNNQTTASKAILSGLAPDGGLYVFDELNKDFFKKDLLAKSYQDLAVNVLNELLDDFDFNSLKEIVKKSYSDNLYKPKIVGIDSFNKYSYLTLYHGFTFAFKDLALSCLPNLMHQAKKINNIKKKTVILTATSGDTGSASLAGFSTLDDTYVIVLYPLKGVSEFQELQMNNYQSNKFKIFAVNGNFDDCQKIVKDVFLNMKPKNILLSSANSINIGRIVSQVVYYVYSYLELVRKNKIKFNEEINVTVPTGNFGNIYAAFLAKKLGVPLHKLIIASNQNNNLTELFNEGKYRINKNLKNSISPSMDILVSSNIERYFFDLLNQDFKTVKRLMNELKTNGEILLKQIKENELFKAFYASETETKATIKKVFNNDKYLIDPHTAVAKFVSDKYQENTKDLRYMLIVSTASPYKFSDALISTFKLSDKGSLKEKMQRIEKYTKTLVDERMLDLLQKKISRNIVSLSQAYNTVTQIVGEIDDQN